MSRHLYDVTVRQLETVFTSQGRHTLHNSKGSLKITNNHYTLHNYLCSFSCVMWRQHDAVRQLYADDINLLGSVFVFFYSCKDQFGVRPK